MDWKNYFKLLVNEEFLGGIFMVLCFVYYYKCEYKNLRGVGLFSDQKILEGWRKFSWEGESTLPLDTSLVISVLVFLLGYE